MQSAVIHIGPSPIELLSTIIEQCEAQDWSLFTILYAGATQARFSLAGARVYPLYFLLFRRELSSEGEMVFPHIVIDGHEIGVQKSGGKNAG